MNKEQDVKVTFNNIKNLRTITEVLNMKERKKPSIAINSHIKITHKNG